ncbi:unnamed protein product [Allacma fusca]|uniref:Uncharacterized protein n=1 Tax=Allacma fusca TaxID=39272 RepID=A0A8J2P7Y6_9HEXA|nr:unnamed protein product [Allacma fusca]
MVFPPMDSYTVLPDPCCGAPLQKAVKIVAIVDMVWAAISAGTLFLFLLLVILEGSSLAQAAQTDRLEFPAFADFMELGTGIVILCLIAFIAVSICYYFLGQYLLHGAMERNHEKVTLWFTITVGLLALRIVYWLIGVFSSTSMVLSGFFGLLSFIYQAYALWVVKAFRDELLRSGESLKLRDNGPRSHNFPL